MKLEVWSQSHKANLPCVSWAVFGLSEDVCMSACNLKMPNHILQVSHAHARYRSSLGSNWPMLSSSNIESWSDLTSEKNQCVLDIYMCGFTESENIFLTSVSQANCNRASSVLESTSISEVALLSALLLILHIQKCTLKAMHWQGRGLQKQLQKPVWHLNCFQWILRRGN